MFELKRIDVWSLVKITFILSFIIGLILGFLYFLFMIFVSQIATTFGGASGIETDIFQLSGAIGLFMVFFIAIFTAVFYTVISAIFAVLYNMVAGWGGGIRMKLEAEQVEQVQNE